MTEKRCSLCYGDTRGQCNLSRRCMFTGDRKDGKSGMTAMETIAGIMIIGFGVALLVSIALFAFVGE